MRILHVVESLDRRLGGLPAAAVAIAGSNARGGHDVSVVAPAGPDESPVTGEEGVAIRTYPLGRLARFSSSPALVEHVRRAPIDLVHVHSTWNLASLRSAQAAQARGVPVLLSPHGSLDPYDLAKHATAKRLLGARLVRPVLAGVARVVCTSPREEQLLVTYGARPRTTSVPLPPGPTLAPRAPGTARASAGVPADAPLVVFVGRIDAKKGLPLLVDAVARLDGVHLVVAGSGDPAHERRVREHVAASAARSRVHVVGWVDPQGRSDLLHDADVFALVSDRENYGIAAVEAVQAGVPTVLSSEVFAGDLLTGAVIVAERDVEAVAEALGTALEPHTNRRMRAAAGRLVDQVLSRAAVDALHEQVVQDVRIP